MILPENEQSIPSFLVKDLCGISTRNYIDWASVAVYGFFLPYNWYEFRFPGATHLLWAGFLGVILTFILPDLTSQRIWLKGGLFGFVIGFFLYGVAIIMCVPFFTETSFATSFTNAMEGILWGITTTEIIKWLDHKYAYE